MAVFKSSTMNVALGSDHAGFHYKEKVKKHLETLGHTVRDFGTFSTDPVDYPDFIRPAAMAVAKKESDRAIIFGGSGNGEAIAANKIHGVRCGLCWTVEVARLNRAHNDGNVLSIGERVTAPELLIPIVDCWLTTPFEGGRHVRRLEKLEPE
jgi:ribose 5-phosphate isomerase B